MKIAELLDKLRNIPEIDVSEERSLKDNRRVVTFSTQKPFPQVGPAWYSMVVHSDDEEIPTEKIEAMLRHLWMFQLNL
jgi:hypothetical protein